MQELGGWADASSIILSCPGPQRRHQAAIRPLAGLALPQMLLGGESQLLAFAAFAARSLALAPRLFFAPMPEIFAAPRGLAAALRDAGGSTLAAGGSDGPVHLRFGGVRSARVLKGIPNAMVLAERAGPPPLTASHHPFATGAVLPAAMSALFALAPDVIRPRSAGTGAISMADLPDGLITADLRLEPVAASAGGLDLACLAHFAPDRWAAGGAQPALSAPPAPAAVLLPWNMDHPGSIVPELLRRLARLQEAGAAVPHIILLPFNYIGQTGITRDLIAHVLQAPGGGGALLHGVFLARVSSLQGVAALLRLGRTAWVDGNDPEHWWTLGRLAAVGATTILLDPATGQSAAGLRLPADEAMWVTSDTRCGAMIFQVRLPSLRALPGLLRLTAAQPPPAAPAAAAPRAAAPAARRRRRPAATGAQA